ncbi:MAG TPA: nucleoside hydrolase [Bryobacteraceae bacterium]|nr:nucleoside hydrolase [Bryobacteraceae bacterium]
MAIPCIIDTDPGVDDALAILFAIASPELYIHAITVVGGNVPLAQCVHNATGIVALAGASIPVAVGLQAPHPGASHVHGEDGLGGAASLLPQGWRPVTASGVDLLLDCERGNTVIALGPLTNLAAACRKDPHRFRRLARIVCMGGAFRTHGNVTASAEFNMHADPDAVNAVLSSGVPMTFVGLDVTTRVRLQNSDLHPGASMFVQQTCERMLAYYRERGQSGFPLHDPLAVAVAAQPDLVQTKWLHVEVETAGRITRGATVADFRAGTEHPPNAEVALDADAPRSLKLFRERVLGAGT